MVDDLNLNNTKNNKNNEDQNNFYSENTKNKLPLKNKTKPIENPFSKVFKKKNDLVENNNISFNNNFSNDTFNLTKKILTEENVFSSKKKIFNANNFEIKSNFKGNENTKEIELKIKINDINIEEFQMGNHIQTENGKSHNLINNNFDKSNIDDLKEENIININEKENDFKDKIKKYKYGENENKIETKIVDSIGICEVAKHKETIEDKKINIINPIKNKNIKEFKNIRKGNGKII